MNALNNLPIQPNNNKKKKQINLFVLRTSNTGKIGLSKPCYKCIVFMLKIHLKRGYQLKNIAYTGSQGEIINTTLTKLSSYDKHISRYDRIHNYHNKIN